MALCQKSGSQLHSHPFWGLMLVFLQMPGVFGGRGHSLASGAVERQRPLLAPGREIGGLGALAVGLKLPGPAVRCS